MPAPDLLSLGLAVRAIRDERGISQVELARASGLQQTWISHIENGRRNPAWSNLGRLADGLGVGVAELAARAEAIAAEQRLV
jgi:XRE family transcriptional regulator, regulator of sulfur utilization